MKNIYTLILLIFIALCTASCVTRGPTYLEAKAKEPSENKAIVYVYRVYAQPTAWGTTLFIDDKEIATLNQKGFTWVYLSPGLHSIQGKWAWLSGQLNTKMETNIESGKTYYVEISGAVKITDVYAGFIFYNVESHLSSRNVIEAQAKLIDCCKFVPPKLSEL